MTNRRVPESIVDFWLGHEIGEMAEAYKRVKFEDVKRLYMEKEPFISITAPPTDINEVEKRFRNELSNQKSIIDSLVKEKDSLKSRMDRYESFTKKFLELSPDELIVIANKMKEEKEKGIGANIKEYDKACNSHRLD